MTASSDVCGQARAAGGTKVWLVAVDTVFRADFKVSGQLCQACFGSWHIGPLRLERLCLRAFLFGSMPVHFRLELLDDADSRFLQPGGGRRALHIGGGVEGLDQVGFDSGDIAIIDFRGGDPDDMSCAGFFERAIDVIDARIAFGGDGITAMPYLCDCFTFKAGMFAAPDERTLVLEFFGNAGAQRGCLAESGLAKVDGSPKPVVLVSAPEVKALQVGDGLREAGDQLAVFPAALAFAM